MKFQPSEPRSETFQMVLLFSAKTVEVSHIDNTMAEVIRQKITGFYIKAFGWMVLKPKHLAPN